VSNIEQLFPTERLGYLKSCNVGGVILMDEGAFCKYTHIRHRPKYVLQTLQQAGVYFVKSVTFFLKNLKWLQVCNKMFVTFYFVTKKMLQTCNKKYFFCKFVTKKPK
jgi:hypothetical protein